MRVFISHSDQDKPAYSSLCLALDGVGISRWDVASLSPGLSLADQLCTAITRCEVCIFLATKQSLQSKWCMAELGAFWGAGKRVMVFLADQHVKEAELPPQFLGTFWTRDAQKLVSAITSVFKDQTKKVADTSISLRTRDRLPKLSESAEHAQEITLVGASLISVMIMCQEFFREILEKGCKLNFIILDPKNSAAIEVWNERTDSKVVREDIERSLVNIKRLAQSCINEGQLYAGLLQTTPPYSVISVDKDSNNDPWLIIELHDYKRSLSDRCHLFINKADSPFWYNSFYRSLTAMRRDSVEWKY